MLNEWSLNPETLTVQSFKDVSSKSSSDFKKSLRGVGDVSQGYHQLVLKPENRPFDRVLLETLIHEVHEFSRFVFGGCYCPFCAQFIQQTHAENLRTKHPLAVKAIRNNYFMDDLMPQVPTVEIAQDTRAAHANSLRNSAGWQVFSYENGCQTEQKF